MSYLKAFFCCDATLQLNNLDTSYEVVKASARNKECRKESRPILAAEIKPISSASINEKRKLYNFKPVSSRTAKLESYASHNEIRQAIFIQPIDFNDGDNSEPADTTFDESRREQIDTESKMNTINETTEQPEIQERATKDNKDKEEKEQPIFNIPVYLSNHF